MKIIIVEKLNFLTASIIREIKKCILLFNTDKMKMKIILIIILIAFSIKAEAQYNFSFTSRHASMHLIVNTNLKKIFEADAKRLRENKVKTITVGNEAEPEFEKYELNTRGFIENLITHNDIYLLGENEKADDIEYNIKYNVGGLISYIYYSPDETALFYEHDFGKLFAIKSESYEMIDYYAKFSYVNELPDSCHTDFTYKDFRRTNRFKIETDSMGLIKRILDVTVPNPDNVFEISRDDKSMTIKARDVKDDLTSFYMPLRADFDNQKYLKFEFANDRISSYTTIKKIGSEVYLYKMNFTYQANGLIESVSITKSLGNKKINSKSYKYKYEFYQ